MKIPQRIYLQIDPECESDNTYLWHEGVTWCQDKINETDIEYVLKQSEQKTSKKWNRVVKYLSELYEVYCGKPHILLGNAIDDLIEAYDEWLN